MAVIRVEKNRNFTTMSNYHLRDKDLSLKAKGLLSQILSLPDDWDYSVRGLASICLEGKDCIVTTLKELEIKGYLVRKQLRDANGSWAVLNISSMRHHLSRVRIHRVRKNRIR